VSGEVIGMDDEQFGVVIRENNFGEFDIKEIEIKGDICQKMYAIVLLELLYMQTEGGMNMKDALDYLTDEGSVEVLIGRCRTQTEYVIEKKTHRM